MRSFSAQYIFTNTGLPLKRSLVKTGDDGTIISVEDTCGDLKEKQSVEFFNGIIIPGFVNCHCHLELSHLRGLIPEKTGLPDFISQIRSRRETRQEDIVSSALTADSEMYHEGINLCADICNTPATFPVKKESPIQYINMLEVFGIDPDKAGHRMLEAAVLAEESGKYGLEGYNTSFSLFCLSSTPSAD
jgi:cytosine/adenosine deaminase-related metal-dependent hydrolase